jgi:hypothetical protein
MPRPRIWSGKISESISQVTVEMAACWNARNMRDMAPRQGPPPSDALNRPAWHDDIAFFHRPFNDHFERGVSFKMIVKRPMKKSDVIVPSWPIKSIGRRRTLLAVLGLIVMFLAFQQAAISTVTWLMLSEIFPLHIKKRCHRAKLAD